MPNEPSHPGRAVFEILVREHADMLTAYLRSLVRDPGAVDDLFQETMLTAWRRLDDYDRTRPFAPWLRGIARRLAMASHRAATKLVYIDDHVVLEDLDRRFERFGSLPGDGFRDRLSHVADCLSRLPESFRESLSMVYSRNMMLKQVAESLGVNEETIKKRVQRARQMLADCVAGAAGASS